MTPADRDVVDRMAAYVHRYSAIIDDRSDQTAWQLMSRLRPLLPQIYSAGLALPMPDAEGEFDQASDGTGASLREELEQLFGQRDMVREVFDPYGEGEEVTIGTVSDSLTDIYSDLLRGLAAFDAGDYEAAAEMWRMDFEIHWGHHILDAMRAFHAWGFGEEPA